MTVLLLVLAVSAAASAQSDSLLVMFWNVENFFDFRSESKPEYWTKGRFYAKCNAVAKLILKVADRFGRLPDAVGFAEVENAFVLKQLIYATLLRKLDYKIVHYESPDHRGIDCALLYRRSTLELMRSGPKHTVDSNGGQMATRDILWAEFGGLDILVNHHPSKVGGKADRRDAAMERMEGIADSLMLAGAEGYVADALANGCGNGADIAEASLERPRRVLAIGDFNETLWPADGRGTIKYNGAWEKIDGYFSWGISGVREYVFEDPLLLTDDAAFGGMKPLRTFSGPRYLGGVSDHLPIVLRIPLLP